MAEEELSRLGFSQHGGSGERVKAADMIENEMDQKKKTGFVAGVPRK